MLVSSKNERLIYLGTNDKEIVIGMTANEKRIIVGVDVSKETLCVYWDGINKPQKYDNESKTLEALAKELKQKVNPTLVVLEATGGFENKFCEILWKAEIPLAKVNPGRIRHFRKAEGGKAKTDPIDARAIYEFGMSIKKIIPLEAASGALLEVKKLVLRREQLMKLATMEKNHLKAPMNDKNTEKSIKTVLNHMRKEIKKLAEKISRLLRAIPEIEKKLKALEQEKGVGDVLLGALLSLVPELGTLNRNTVASLVGVAPFNQESGKVDGKRVIQGGRFVVRKLLYMASLSVVRHNPTIKKFYMRMLESGKCKKVALVASMRKFLIRLNTLAREALMSDPSSAEQGA